jgi:hypothetical protein
MACAVILDCDSRCERFVGRGADCHQPIRGRLGFRTARDARLQSGSADANQAQAVLDTPPVTLSANGNASFSGEFTTVVPPQCASPLFLIRLGPEFGLFGGRWLATGVEPRFGNSNDHRGGHEHDDN